MTRTYSEEIADKVDVERSFECSVETIREVRKWIADHLTSGNVRAEDIGDVLVAASEALTNAVVHGYEPTRRGRVDVRLHVSDGSMTLTIRDYGSGFHRDQYAAPDTNLPHEGGYGVYLIRRLMDDVRVSSLDQGTEVKMVKNLRPDPKL